MLLIALAASADACDRAFEEYEQRLLQSPARQAQADRVRLHHFQWLLKAGRVVDAKTLAEGAISAHLEGSHRLAVEAAKELQAHLWNLGVDRFDVRAALRSLVSPYFCSQSVDRTSLCFSGVHVACSCFARVTVALAHAHTWLVTQKREHAPALEWFMYCYRLSEVSEPAHKATLLRCASLRPLLLWLLFFLGRGRCDVHASLPG